MACRFGHQASCIVTLRVERSRQTLEFGLPDGVRLGPPMQVPHHLVPGGLDLGEGHLECGQATASLVTLVLECPDPFLVDRLLGNGGGRAYRQRRWEGLLRSGLGGGLRDPFPVGTEVVGRRGLIAQGLTDRRHAVQAEHGPRAGGSGRLSDRAEAALVPQGVEAGPLERCEGQDLVEVELVLAGWPASRQVGAGVGDLGRHTGDGSRERHVGGGHFEGFGEFRMFESSEGSGRASRPRPWWSDSTRHGA